MATTCDYCGEPITEGRVSLVPTPDPATMLTDEALDFHIECQRAFLSQAKDAISGDRPVPESEPSG